MAMNEQNSINQMPVPHNVILEDRRRLTVSGVCDVDSFDEQTVIVFTQMGELTVKGEDLHINRLSLEMGELALEGDITALTYTDRAQKLQQGSFWGRVFR
ncbi:MAG: sporulation protein YabP [Candidatus Fimenecus sp.]